MSAVSKLALLLLVSLAGCALETSAISPGAGDASDDDSSVRAQDASDDDSSTLADDATLPPVDTGLDTSPPPPDARPADSGVADATMLSDSAPVPGFCDTSDPTLLVCIRFEDALVDEAHGRPFRGSGYGFSAGRVGRALEHGAADSVWMDSLTDLPILPFTFETWMRPTALPSAGRVGVVDFDGAFGVFMYPGGAIGCKASEQALTAPGAVVSGTWAHLACVFEAGRIRAYVNGVEAADAASSYAGGSTTAGFRFGGNSPSGDDFVGRIDEARFFSDARTPAEIAAAAAR